MRGWLPQAAADELKKDGMEEAAVADPAQVGVAVEAALFKTNGRLGKPPCILLLKNG